MCSTPAITLFFVICDIVSGYYVYIKKTKYRNIFLVFIGFYGIMELLQFIQWIYGDINICTYRNKFFTKPPLGLEPIIAFILIWLQPLLFSWIGLVSTYNSYYKFGFNLSLLALIFGIFNMQLSYYTNKSIIYENTNFGETTCTIIGKYGHLLWKFSVLSLNYHPSYFVYLGIILLCIFKYPNVLKFTIGLGWFYTLLISLYLVNNSPELPSFWCLLSIFANIPIILYTKYTTTNIIH